MRQTIAEQQELHFQNVVSTFYETSVEELSTTFESFLMTIFKAGYTAVGPFFYCINSDKTIDGKFLVQVFLPVVEAHEFDLPSDFIYQTRFQVIDLTATRVLGDSEHEISQGVARLLTHIRKRRLQPRTPVFYLVTVDDDDIYTDIMIGIDYDS